MKETDIIDGAVVVAVVVGVSGAVVDVVVSVNSYMVLLTLLFLLMLL